MFTSGPSLVDQVEVASVDCQPPVVERLLLPWSTLLTTSLFLPLLLWRQVQLSDLPVLHPNDV